MEEEEEETDPTESTVLQIKFIAYSVIAYIIVGVGIVGNLLNLVVLTRPNLKGVMYVYLLGLAVSNLCVLLSAVPALFDIAGGGLAGRGPTPPPSTRPTWSCRSSTHSWRARSTSSSA
jgi:hypothetical protein